MPACAFLTMDDLTGFVSYDALVREPLERRGWGLDEVPWRSTTAVWQDYDVVVIRTTWDYQNAPVEFIGQLERIASVTRLENPIALVRWNLHKSYLRELSGQGILTVPTLWRSHITPATLRDAFDELGTDQLVIKPQVGANADDTFHLRRGDAGRSSGAAGAASGGARAAFDGGRATFDGGGATFAAATTAFTNRACMLQPFVPSVTAEGEYSLVYFDGRYSHTILKTPKPADFRVQEEHGGVITAVPPEPRLLERAAQVMATFATPPLYARVDLVRTASDDFALMELELIEPSLYLSYDEDAAERFASAIADRGPVARSR